MKEHELIIKQHLNEPRGRQIDASATVQVSLGHPGRLIGVWELEPIRFIEGDSTLINLSLGLAAGIAANLIRSDPGISCFRLRCSGPIHRQWQDIFDLYSTLSGVRFVIDAELTAQVSRPAAIGPVALVSGGKDTLFALQRAAQRGSLNGVPSIYLGAGSELNWLEFARFGGSFALFVLPNSERGRFQVSSKKNRRYDVKRFLFKVAAWVYGKKCCAGR